MTHPPVPHTCFWHKWAAGAVRTAPVTIPPVAPAHEGSLDGSCVGQFRDPPRALGLQLPETAAAWSTLAAVPASSSRRSSNSGLGTTRTKPAWCRSERNGMPTTFKMHQLRFLPGDNPCSPRRLARQKMHPLIAAIAQVCRCNETHCVRWLFVFNDGYRCCVQHLRRRHDLIHWRRSNLVMRTILHKRNALSDMCWCCVPNPRKRDVLNDMCRCRVHYRSMRDAAGAGTM